MKKRLLRLIGPFFGLAVFALALWALHRELHEYHYHDIARALAQLARRQTLAGALFSLMSYLVLTLYDTLAIRYMHHPVAYRKIGLASFLASAFNHNIGYSVLSSGPVRFRLYTGWGLSAAEVAKVVVFSSVTVWLGFFALAGVAFVVEPVAVPATLHLPFPSARFLGVLFLAVVAGYLLWSRLATKPLTLASWELPAPSVGLSAAQITLSGLDWGFAGAALYVLLPPEVGLSFPAFLGLFLLGHVIGIASQVPGGLGVFETVIVLSLAARAPAAALLGALLAYRVIYYLVPLVLAVLLLGSYELVLRREGVKRVTRMFGRWAPALAPSLLAVSSFLGGAILLFSGATPGARDRLALLRDLLPLPVVELSHFLGSLAGVGLLLLARGLQRRLDAAYVIAAVLLGAGATFSLLKGFDYEEAIVLGLLLAALLPSRRHFYRKASLFAERLSLGWIAAIAIVLGGSAWLGFFSHKHVQYAGELWWQFAFTGDAPRFLRAGVGATAVLVVFGLGRLMRPAPVTPGPASADDLAVARALIPRCPETYASLALLGDKSFLFNEARTAFLMYGVSGRSWVAMGDPVGGEDEERTELVWRFREIVDRNGGWPVFYEVGRRDLHLYLDMGLTLQKLGEEARVRLDQFSLEGAARKGMRYTYNRLEREACSFEMVPREGVAALLSELRAISDAWLADRRAREKHFSLGCFEETYLLEFPVGIVRQGGAVVAFATVWPGNGRDELSVDLMRYSNRAPHGTMDYLFVHLMLWGKATGYRWFNLGMAPLAGLDDRALAPLWNRLAAVVFRHGEHFYNFQGLRAYKQKFDPEWQPRYLASPGGFVLPRIVANTASLISGGLRGVIAR